MSTFFNIVLASSATTITGGASTPIETHSITTVLTVSQISIATLYWLKPHKSSDFTEFTTTKPYFWIWSTNHDNGDGGIYWGEADDLLGTNFVERGLILSGFQIETPQLIRIPTAISGISDELFIYAHTTLTEPGSNSKQQTRLYTTSGGNAPHLSTYTDRGRPLGIFADDAHTGYLKPFKRAGGGYIGNHLTVGGGSPKFYTSISTNGLTWTRLNQLILTANLPSGSSLFDPHQIEPFVYNGIRYGFAIVKNSSGIKELALLNLDVNNQVTGLDRIVENTLDYKTIMLRIEGTIAYIYVQGGDNTLTSEPTKLFRWDLINI